MEALNSHFNVTGDMFFFSVECQTDLHGQNFSHQKITISFYCRMERVGLYVCVYIVVNFLSQVISVLLLFLGMVMYANEVETKEK